MEKTNRPIALPNMAKPQDPDKRMMRAHLSSAAMNSKADKLLRKFSWEKE